MAQPNVRFCPECRNRKQQNCDGRSWDDLHDAPAPCPCALEGHPEEGA